MAENTVFDPKITQVGKTTIKNGYELFFDNQVLKSDTALVINCSALVSINVLSMATVNVVKSRT